MPVIAIVFNKKQLSSIFKNFKFSDDEKNVYLDFSDGDLIGNYFLSTGGFEEISISDNVNSDPEIFLKRYIKLISKVGAFNNTLEWWVTNIASKNRFTSNIPVLLQQIEGCAKIIATFTDNLIIYKPDYCLIATLKNLCAQSSIKLILPKSHVRYCLNKQRFLSCLSHLKSSLRLVYRIAVVRLFYKLELDKGLDNKVTALKSFFYESSIDEKKGYSYKDPIFGRLPDFFADRNKLLILTHIMGRYRPCIKKINQQKNFTIVPVEYWLSIKSILSSLYKVPTSCCVDKIK